MSAFSTKPKRVLTPEQRERQRAYLLAWRANKRAERAANPQPRKPRHAPAHIRFERSYIPEPNSGCWLWTGSVSAGRYGSIVVDKKTIKAHRYSLMLVGRDGPAPCCLHRCDTPLCVNPDHLLLGSHADNMRDMIAKGRGSDMVGQSNPNAKLSEEQVRKIRRSALSRRTLAEKYGVSTALISKIRSREAWGHLND